MDFVVAGLGFGALIVVIGFVIRDLGPLLWKRLGYGAFSRTDDERERWRAFCHSIATILTVAGSLVLIATVVAIFAGVSDNAGELVVIVATAITVIGMIVAIATTARAYQELAPVKAFNLGIASEQSDLVASSLKSGASTGEVTTVRRIEQQSPMIVESADSPESLPSEPMTSPEPEIEESFDATKLLPSEFDENFDHQDAALFQRSNAEIVTDSSTAPPAAVAEGKSDEDQTAIVETVPAALGVFKSRLLADIGVPESPETANGGFASNLLADVDRTAVTNDPNYQSPLLADLANETQPEESAEASEPASVETESESDSGEKPADDKLKTSDAKNDDTLV